MNGYLLQAKRGNEHTLIMSILELQVIFDRMTDYWLKALCKVTEKNPTVLHNYLYLYHNSQVLLTGSDTGNQGVWIAATVWTPTV